MDKETIKSSKKAGLPPGTLIHVGKKKSEHSKITIYHYNEKTFSELEFNEAEKIKTPNDNSLVTWLNLDGIHKIELIEAIGKQYNLHALSLEDVLNTNHRPKAEFYQKYVLFTLKMLGIHRSGNKLVLEQVSFILGQDYLISFQEQEGDVFDGVRDRIKLSKGKIREKKADYLLYALIDSVIDNYYIIIEHFSDTIEKLEEQVLENPDENTLTEIQHIKRQFITLRRSVYPLREAISSLLKDDSDLIEEDNQKYLRDLYDHTIHIIESIESQRDVISGLKDLYISELSNRMNNTMKVLTIIATIFIPLTFIAGIYGMNFEFMPELKWKWSYPIVWIIMVIISIGMLIYFKRRKWL
ncbi:MAG: magnesium/cobalt transporter CorA [Vicingus serpentipes]|nr:magnesium/cobalt transporter CorA [Vicingus serpentipes]